MRRAASAGMTPASASAAASARSKSSMDRTNASADSAWAQASRAKLRPTRFTARLLDLYEHRLAGAAQPDVPPVDLRMRGIARGDQRAEPLGIADGAGQGIVLDRLERG